MRKTVFGAGLATELGFTAMSGLAFSANAATGAPSTWTVRSDVLDVKVTVARGAGGLNAFGVEPDIAHRAAVIAAIAKAGATTPAQIGCRPGFQFGKLMRCRAVFNLTAARTLTCSYGYQVPEASFNQVRALRDPGKAYNALAKGRRRAEVNSCPECHRLFAACVEPRCPSKHQAPARLPHTQNLASRNRARELASE